MRGHKKRLFSLKRVKRRRVNIPSRQERQWRHPAPRPLPPTAGSPREPRWYPELHSRSRTPASRHSSRPGRSAPLRGPSAGPAARLCGPPPRGPAGLRGSVSGRTPAREALPGAADGSLPPPGGWWKRRQRSRQQHPGQSPGEAIQSEGATRGLTHPEEWWALWMPSCGRSQHQVQNPLLKTAEGERWSSLRSELHRPVSPSDDDDEGQCVVLGEEQCYQICADNPSSICFACVPFGTKGQRFPLVSFCELPRMSGSSKEAPSPTERSHFRTVRFCCIHKSTTCVSGWRVNELESG